jgi:alpha-galactosidase/6-phospho-beta-glucosidase family protein
VRKLVALIDNNLKPDVKNVDLYEFLIMLKRSWNEVTEQTIRNCFKKSGLSFHDNESHEYEFEEEFDNTLWTELIQNMGLNDLHFKDFVNFDNELAVTDEISNGKDLDSSEMDVGIDSDETIIDENDSEESEKSLKLIDALNAITQL